MESGGSSWKLNGLLFDPWRQWWILGEANEAVASGPPFLGAPPSKTAYTVLDSLSGRFGVKTFFFFFFFFF